MFSWGVDERTVAGPGHLRDAASPLRVSPLGRRCIYQVGVVDFFNARHAIGSEPAHSHSWKVEICVRRPRYLGEQSLIGLEETRGTLRNLFGQYEDRFLNEIPPFTFQEPTTENLVLHLFEQLEEEFRGTEAALYSLTIWESPTHYVTIFAEE